MKGKILVLIGSLLALTAGTATVLGTTGMRPLDTAPLVATGSLFLLARVRKPALVVLFSAISLIALFAFYQDFQAYLATILPTGAHFAREAPSVGVGFYLGVLAGILSLSGGLLQLTEPGPQQ